jgi:hypothetical protein
MRSRTKRRSRKAQSRSGGLRHGVKTLAVLKGRAVVKFNPLVTHLFQKSEAIDQTFDLIRNGAHDTADKQLQALGKVVSWPPGLKAIGNLWGTVLET